MGEHGRAVALDTRVELDPRPALAQQLGEPILTLTEWPESHVMAIVLQQIEGAKRNRLVVLLGVQQIEVGQAIRAADDALAVERGSS